jgi:hypothetical protein
LGSVARFVRSSLRSIQTEKQGALDTFVLDSKCDGNYVGDIDSWDMRFRLVALSAGVIKFNLSKQLPTTDDSRLTFLLNPSELL